MSGTQACFMMEANASSQLRSDMGVRSSELKH